MKRNLSVRLNLNVMFALVIAMGMSLEFAMQGQPVSSTNALTLDEAIRLALANNPSLRASGAQLDAAAARAFQARKWSNPELELAAEEWPLENGRGFSDSKQTIGVAQMLPFPGKKSLDRRIGDEGVKLSEAEVTLRRTELVRDVKAAFFNALAAGQRLIVAGELLQVAESSAATARKRVDAGAAAYQEQLRAEILLEEARVELSNDERALGAARQTLVTLLGRPDFKDAPLAGALAETPEDDLLRSPATDVLARHPSLRAAQANVDRARLESRRARLEPYPDMKAGVAGGRLGDTDESIIELRFSVPLPIFDTGKGKRREAEANLTRAEAELQAVQQQWQQEWANAQKRYRTAIEQASNYRERILPKANEALRLVQTGFEQGKFGFIDLLDTQRTTAEARLTYQQKLLELNIAQAEIEALLPRNPVGLKPAPDTQSQTKP
jgi:outer membrane protein, heavy metal efflux system